MILILELVIYVLVDPHEGSEQKTSMCQVYPLCRMALWNIGHELWFNFPNNEGVFLSQFFITYNLHLCHV